MFLLKLLRRVPLAWLNLTYNRRRLVTALAGVAFAVLLMFMFKGFENALYDSQVQLLKLLNGELILVNKLKYTMFVPEQFARRRLYQAQAFAGVEAAYPLYTAMGNWKNPETKRIRPLRVLAFNLADPVLPLPGIVQNRAALQMPRTALIDAKSRDEVGPLRAGVVTELSEKRVEIVGTFRLGTDFAAGNGNVVMSDRNFLRYFAQPQAGNKKRTLGTVDIGLLKLAPGTDAVSLAATMRKTLPADILVLPKADFLSLELKYWRENTSIGFVFSLLTVMSFLVGVILVYQILYTDVSDHWAEYATLKAMGYTNFFLFGIVIQEAVFLGGLGFIPGFVMSAVFYQITAESTGLLMQMTIDRVVSLLIATFFMCVISGAIAVRKVQENDPAEVFG